MPEKGIDAVPFAQLAWQVLVARAALQATIHYEQLKFDIGWPGATQALGQVLNPIYRYCRSKNLPDLTILAVLKAEGRPGRANTIKNVDKERELVFEREWFKVPPPSAEELRKSPQPTG